MELLKFSERLEELIFDTELPQNEFAGKCGLTPVEISKYLKGNCMPSLSSVLKIADFFKCSVDYVLGIEDQKYSTCFHPIPPFAQRLRFLLPHFGYTGYRFCKEAKNISAARYYDWLNGKHEPSLENIINIAEFFDCSVDFVIGRSN